MDAQTFFTDILPIPDEALRAQIVSLAQFRHLSKGELLVREGETINQLSFLLSGILRGFFFDYNGRDITDCFGAKCGVPAIPVFQLDAPSLISIEALTDSQLLCIPVADAMTLLENDVRTVHIYNSLLRNSLLEHWQIKTVLHKRTSMERYQWFLQAYPGLIDQVTHRYIASFLEMSPVTLSCLRAALKQGE